MITRLEVDGFKNLTEFTCDFSPYTCIAGPNAVGKSNLFDALVFLSSCATRQFNEAALEVRGAEGQIGELFAPGYDRITFGVELLVPSTVTDEFGRATDLEHTYLRYELGIERHEGERGMQGAVGLKLAHESLDPLSEDHARDNVRWVEWGNCFTTSAFRFAPITKRFIATDAKVVDISREGANPLCLPLHKPVGFSAVSSTGLYDFPYVKAAQEEMKSWRTLALETSAMRAASGATASDRVSAIGGNLPMTFARLTDGGSDEAVIEDIVDSLRSLVDVRDLSLDFDRARQVFTLYARVGGAPMLPARSLSDGTLRFLALSLLYFDPEARGVICMEEPENGIHPRKIEEMYRLLRDIAVDPDCAVDESNPLRQVIVNTHSLGYIHQHRDTPGSLLLASTRPGTRSLKLSPVRTAGTWRADSANDVPFTVVEEMMEESLHGVGFGAWEASG